MNIEKILFTECCITHCLKLNKGEYSTIPLSDKIRQRLLTNKCLTSGYSPKGLQVIKLVDLWDDLNNINLLPKTNF